MNRCADRGRRPSRRASPWPLRLAAFALLILPVVDPPRAASAQDGVDPGRLLVERCTKCHGAESYGNKTHSRLAWHLVVLRMQVLHGTHLAPGDRDLVVDQLASASPAPTWRVGLDWIVLLAGPAGASIWFWRRRHRGGATGAPAYRSRSP